ncbi:MAG: hypothetical protein VKI82_07850 [Leptolyngbya sp.]|nr:hypothetical protein [Leptolyngbya sp.]
MLLRELEAFEACWLDLRDQYPTNRQDNTLIAHAMGQLVDLVEKPDQVELSLPDHLKILFRRLALAYFQGYIPHDPATSSAPPAPRHTPHQPVATVLKAPPEQRQKQEISVAVEQVRVLAKQAQARVQQSRSRRQIPDPKGFRAEDMETLVVDFPEHWHNND